jgi:hypothetical protein
MQDNEKINSLIERIEQSADRYVCMCGLPAARARVWFRGVWQGGPVVWEADLRALQCDADIPASAAGRVDTGQAANYIDIAPVSAGGIQRLAVGLAIRQIDEAVIRKVMIMINNYKNLRVGRHQWG